MGDGRVGGGGGGGGDAPSPKLLPGSFVNDLIGLVRPRSGFELLAC